MMRQFVHGQSDFRGWVDATPALIAAAPNGARRGKTDHPRLPMTAAETARDAAECLEAGAAMLHLHIRDREGRHSLDADAYRLAIDAVRAATGGRMLIQATTEAAGLYAPAQQAAMIRALKPKAVSLALRELMGGPGGLGEAEIAALLLWMKREAVWPQFILYDEADAQTFAALKGRGVIPFAQPFALFVLGRYSANLTSDPADLLPLLAAAGEAPGLWQLCAFGEREAECMAAAMARGGHARVGFENNLRLPDGRLAAANADLVRLCAQTAATLGRSVMDADGARALMAASLER
ncbi:MAG: 3-keto-5-aminohexanoate cleavage protein [Hyphomicrobiales bacterium]|nr:3-keto-5-aminohexanoate cleavage protein [Hyphomicrobiales bacterium]